MTAFPDPLRFKDVAGTAPSLEHAVEDSLETERLELMEYLLSDYYAFATVGLGNRPEDFAGFADPGVIDYVDRFGKIIRNWHETRHTQKTFRKVIVCVSRECMKSTLITQVAPVYMHCLNPEIAIAISSATMDAKPSALEFAAGVAKHWEGANQHSLLPALWGNFKGPVWRANKMVTSHRLNRTRRDPTLGVFSVQTGGTSGHFDGVILDDPITLEQIDKYGMGWLDSVWTHYLSLGYVVRKDGILIIVVTRYGELDLIGRIITTEIEPIVRERTILGAPPGTLPDDFHLLWHKYAHLAGWDVINLAAEFDEEGNRAITFPIIWPQERIDAERLKSPGTVAAVLNNRPGEREDNPIQPHHIERSYFEKLDDVPPQAFNWVTIQCDLALKSTSARAEGRGDRTVIQVWAHFDGHVYLIWSWRGRPLPEEFDEKLLAAVKFVRYGPPQARVRLISYDRPEGQGNADRSYTARHFEALFADNGLSCPRLVEIPRQGQSKMGARILATASFWVAGMVHMLRGSPCSSEIAHQVLHPTGGSYDDDADAMADVFNENVYLRRAKKKEGGPDSRMDPDRWRPRPAVHGHFDTSGRFVLDGHPSRQGGRRWR